jgi:hypothetical protein
MGPGSRTALIAFAWIAFGATFYGAALAAELSVNFFDWRPRLTLVLVVAIGICLTALAFSTALHRVTRGAVPMATAAVVTLMLAFMGFARLPPETVNPGTVLGRTHASPLAFRIAYAVALSLPALLLAVRRWPVDSEDAWFRKHATRLLPPCAVLALGLVVAGVTGRRSNDPARYDAAAEVLGGPSGLVVAAQFALTIFEGMLAAMDPAKKPAPPPYAAVDYRKLLDEFFRSDQVSTAIKDEVRANCSNDENPSEAHTCARRVISDGRLRAQRARENYLWLALSAVPIGAFAIAVGWRARRPREENSGSALRRAGEP